MRCACDIYRMPRDPRYKSYTKIRQVSPLTDEHVARMVEDNLISRVIDHRDERGPSEYWLIPIPLAKEFKIDAKPFTPEVDSEQLPDWFITEDGFVGWLTSYHSSPFKRYKNAIRKIWNGPLLKAYGGTYQVPKLTFINSNLFRDGTLRSQAFVVEHDWSSSNHHNRQNDPRIKAMLRLLLAGYAPIEAYMEAFSVYAMDNARFAVSKLMDRMWFKEKLQMALKKRINEILKEEGFNESVEDFGIRSRVKIIRDSLELGDGKGFSTALKGIKELEDLAADKVILNNANKKTTVIKRSITSTQKNKLLSGATATETTTVTEQVDPDTIEQIE